MEEGGTSLISNFQWRSWLWSTIEYPWTSSLAQFLACFSLFMVRLYGGNDGDGVGDAMMLSSIFGPFPDLVPHFSFQGFFV